MTCEEFKDLVGAWALGALDDAESKACEQHLSEPGPHSDCAGALARARETAVALSTTLPPAKPSRAVWDAIEREIGTQPKSMGRWRERTAWTLAIAASVAVAVLGWALQQERAERTIERASLTALRDTARSSATTAQAAAQKSDADRVACLRQVAALKDDAQLQHEALALLEDPATKVVTLGSPDGHGAKASALVNIVSQRAIVLSAGLPSRPDKDFELWVIRGKNAPKPAGFLRVHSDGTAAGEIDRTLLAEGAPDALAVSVEPTGGRPTPTEVILVGAVKS